MKGDIKYLAERILSSKFSSVPYLMRKSGFDFMNFGSYLFNYDVGFTLYKLFYAQLSKGVSALKNYYLPNELWLLCLSSS